MQESTLQVACFRAGGRECAVDVMRIAEVLPPVPVTPLPGAPGFVEGIIELRGRFLPVVDLRRRFGDGAAPGGAAPASAAPAAPAGKLLVAPLGPSSVALMVDDVTGVDRIPTDRIQPPPSLGAGPVAPALVSGLIKWQGRVLLLVDIDAVLTETEKSELAALP
ncbi:MAG TPA: chemotaxis protein CheW [Kofleriaceae bacterium]|nr:chemotaxis protein CheW [Kofleriaceae bacterium]